jgi:hypothetical protein
MMPAKPLCALQYNAAKHIVIARETLTFKNKGGKAVNQLVLCQPADLVPNRAFYEVRGLASVRRRLEISDAIQIILTQGLNQSIG